MKNSMFKKMFIPYVLKRVYMERLGEPLIYNIISLYYFFFGKFSEKVEYDLVPREPYAFGILEAAKQAKKIGLDGITVIEFGVAAGGGFLICVILPRRFQRKLVLIYKLWALIQAQECHHQ